MKNARIYQFMSVCLFLVLMVSFQNCSIYKSDGVEDFARTLASQNSGSGCLPYIDINDAARFMNISNGVNVTAIRNTDPISCSFLTRNATTSVTDQIVCVITTSSATYLDEKANLSTELFSQPPISQAEALNILSEVLDSDAVDTQFHEGFSTPEVYGYSYERIDQGEVDTFYKFIGGRRGSDPSNVCSGGSCAECTFVAQGRSRSEILSAGQQDQILQTLSDFVNTIIPRN